MKKTIKALILIIIILISWSTYQYITITRIGEAAEARAADVIIVLGAAVWPMGASPALQARIRHSESVYRQGLADAFILTGGLGKYPPSEAEVMKENLIYLGVGEDALFLEQEATNTYENIRFSKEIMKQQGWETAIIVTDVFHMKRALIIAKKHGIEAFGAPVRETTLYKNKVLKFRYTVREVLAIAQYYINSLIKN